MARLFWLAVGVLALLFVLQGLNVFTGQWAVVVDRILALACALACPLFFLSLFYAPGLFRELTGGVRQRWERLVSRREEVAELQRKIAQMGKPHHMALLGATYLRQGRTAPAREWLEKALDQQPDLLDARYRLGLCCFEQNDLERAAELLEEVHAQRPEHDYGMAYLRLAQAHHRLGHLERAGEVYQELLRYYPSQPEGTYHYALLEDRQGRNEQARRLLEDMIVSMRFSPRFQRRRNRHWMLKARWWLWKNR